MKLLFLDVETNGIQPVKPQLLEVAVVAVEGCRLWGSASWVLHHEELHYENDFVRDMHQANGLEEEVLQPGWTYEDVDHRLTAFINAFTQDVLPVHVAGRNVQFDVGWLRRFMTTPKLFHHRLIDLSTLEHDRGKAERVPTVEGYATHRALPDTLLDAVQYVAMNKRRSMEGEG